jgi:hypothetical protein
MTHSVTMENNATPDRLDLRPWAAYVVGGQPYDLHLKFWVMERKFEHCAFVDKASFGLFRGSIHELRKALSALAYHRQVDPVVMGQILTSTSRLEQMLKQRIAEQDFPDAGDGGDTDAMTLMHWWELAEHAMEAVGPSQDLRTWCRLGAAVGRVRLNLEQHAHPDLSTGIKHVRNLLPELRPLAGGEVVKDVKATLTAIRRGPVSRDLDARVRIADRQSQAVAALDRRLRETLSQRAAPEPLLVLNRQRIILFGHELLLSELPQKDSALLWVLAEKPSQLVSRSEIISEGRIGGSPRSLKCRVSRLRKRLKTLIAMRCQCPASRSEPPAKNIIVQARGQTWGDGGPYKLDLDPDRVVVQGDRPAWMKHRESVRSPSESPAAVASDSGQEAD